MTITRRRIVQAATASPLLGALGQRAQAFQPLDSTSLVCGFAVGGTADVMCRRVAPRIVPGFAKLAVTDNRTGAAGQIAISHVKGRPADGTSILMTPTSMMSIYPHIYKKLPYDPIADFTPISLACVFNYGFAVGPAVPANVRSAPDFLTWAKAHPDGANYGSPGAGSTAHFIGTLMGKSAGLDLRHIAYRGGQPAMLDLLGGNVSGVIAPIGTLEQHMSSGKVRILAVSADERSRFTPGVPTFAEQGMPNLSHKEWFGFFLPAKAPDELVRRLNADLRAALATQDVIDGVGAQGLEAMSSSPAALGALLSQDLAKWGPIVRQIGFSAES